MFGIAKIKDRIIKKIKSFEGWISDGNNYLDVKDYKNAADCYYNALNKNPNDDKAWYSMAYALYKLGDYKASFDAINEALKLNQDNPTKYHYLKGSIYYALGRYIDEDESYNLEDNKSYLEEAFTNLNSYYEQNRQNTSALIKMGKILIYFGEFEKAHIIFKKCYNLNPNSVCRDFIKNYNITIKNIDSFEYIERGLSLLNSKKYIDAIKYINKAYELNELNELPIYYKSCIYEYFRDYKKALSCIDTSLRMVERDIFFSKKEIFFLN